MSSHNTRNVVVFLILAFVVSVAIGVAAHFAIFRERPGVSETCSSPKAECLDPNPEYTRFDATAYTGETGKVVVPYRGESTLFTTNNAGSGRGICQYDSKDGTFVIPVGKHTFTVFYAYVRSDGKVTWSAQSDLGSREIEVLPGKTVKMNVGPPYTASVKVEHAYHDNIYASLCFTGQGGEDVRIQRVAGKAKEPGFQMLSAKGKVLMQGEFAYG